ncbi:MAG: hypothetical protein AB8Y67_02600 [Coxiella-like endosymbiont]
MENMDATNPMGVVNVVDWKKVSGLRVCCAKVSSNDHFIALILSS